MLTRIIDHFSDKKRRDLACTYGGMGLLLAGQKTLGLVVFAKGFAGLEEAYRATNEFEGTGEERWARAVAFYEATHQDGMNRLLHQVGIPMILSGAAGLLVFKPFRPLWAISAGSFTLGWTLNFIGHGVFEKKAPAFADDPLSFIAGPAWDLGQLKAHVGRLLGGAPAPAAPLHGNGTNGSAPATPRQPAFSNN